MAPREPTQTMIKTINNYPRLRPTDKDNERDVSTMDRDNCLRADYGNAQNSTVWTYNSVKRRFINTRKRISLTNLFLCIEWQNRTYLSRHSEVEFLMLRRGIKLMLDLNS